MSMFCFQCEQTARGTGCTLNGVCGKKADTAILQDRLTGELIGLARAAKTAAPTESAHQAVIDGLFTTVTNVSFENEAILRQIERPRPVPVDFVVKKELNILSRSFGSIPIPES